MVMVTLTMMVIIVMTIVKMMMMMVVLAVMKVMVTMMMMTAMKMRRKIYCESALVKVETDKLMDKNFKKEFPGLGFHQVALLFYMFFFFSFLYRCTNFLQKYF